MSKEQSLSSEGGVTISFGERFHASHQFDAVFKEGMALVERTAAYLDGDGRAEAKTLKSPASMLYATESMRLTTRLLEIASWLLIRRALREGEITQEEAERKRQRLKLKSLGRPQHTRQFEELPAGLRDLVEKSFALQDRVIQLDRSLSPPAPAPVSEAETGANPVKAQITLLQSAFRR